MAKNSSSGVAAAVTLPTSIKRVRVCAEYGRKAAGVAGFSYSDSLKQLSVRRDDASLDKWLINPDAMAPDTDMAFRLADGAERKAVIAYLKSLGGQ